MAARINRVGNLLPFVGMVIAILAQTSSMVVSKVAMSDGLNKYVMVVCSYGISSLVLLPVAIFLHRSGHPLPSISALSSFFVLSFFSCSSEMSSYIGIDFSSPTVATAMMNLIPAFTFILALIFRMEEVNWRYSSSIAKVLGTIVSIGGAFIVVFYKGLPLFNAHSSVHSKKLQLSPQLNWILGGFFCASSSLLISLWYIYEKSVIERYPAVMIAVFYQFLFCTVQTAVFALIAARDQGAWLIKLDMNLVAILYQALVGVVVRGILCIWCVQKAGPLFCTMFKPLGIIFAVFISAIFLGDTFHLGSLVGAVITVVGFYAVMWGKATERKKAENLESSETLESSSCHKVPLLQNKISQIHEYVT